MNSSILRYTDSGEGENTQLFEAIAQNIYDKGYSIHPNALSPDLTSTLWLQLQKIPSYHFRTAGIGRDNEHVLNQFVRSDEVCWINAETEAGKVWLEWATSLQNYLNRRLLLGLFSFESHFAHYAPGSFYKKHLDAFKGEANRVLSLVVYLNPGWLPDNGGELLIYTGQAEQETVKVTPGFGTVVAFLSEDFPHEVLQANRDRYSIAGWFRVNSSSPERVDPPV